jgi:hypothetical protein
MRDSEYSWCRTIRPGAVRLPSGTFATTHTPCPMSSYCEYAPAPAAHCYCRSDRPTRSSACERHTSEARSAANEEAEENERRGSCSEAEGGVGLWGVVGEVACGGGE